jgi:hypothetical protein
VPLIIARYELQAHIPSDNNNCLFKQPVNLHSICTDSGLLFDAANIAILSDKIRVIKNRIYFRDKPVLFKRITWQPLLLHLNGHVYCMSTLKLKLRALKHEDNPCAARNIFFNNET